jgi:hydrogenase maturation protease
MSGSILIACIGNIFLGDDGFGFEVAQALAGSPLPVGAELVDYGIRGLDLAYALLRPWQAVIMVDAIGRGGAPGTLYLLQPAESQETGEQAGLDPHAMDPVRVLATARSLGEVSASIYIVGCEPQDFGDEGEGYEPGGRMGLSPAVAAAVPEAARMVLDLAEKLTSTAAPECAA